MQDPRTRIISLQQRIATLKVQRKSTADAEMKLRDEVTKQLRKENREDRKRRVA